MHIELIENVPKKRRLPGVFWRQGGFYFYGQKRVATVTDVKFLSEHRLIVAHRAAAKLSLIDISQEPARVIHSLRLGQREERFRKHFFHPDLMALDGDSLYLSDYSNRYAKVTISKTRLKLEEILSVGDDNYHGCAVDDEEILLGGVRSQQITRVDKRSGSVRHLDVKTSQSRRIKTIGTHNEFYVLSLDKLRGTPESPECRGDAWFSQYSREGDSLTEVDSVLFRDCQIDGHVSAHGLHFVAIHDGVGQCGYIVTLKITDRIKVVKKTRCDDFPHGLDVYGQKLAYSAYSTSSVHVRPLSDYLPSESV